MGGTPFVERPMLRDADLVVRTREGDLDAFSRLIARHRSRLHELARHIAHDRDAAQDIVQEALLRAFRSLGALRAPDRVGPWLNTITRRVAQQWLRDGDHRPEPVGETLLRGVPAVFWAAPPEPPPEVVEAVRAALSVLTTRERRAMVLHYLEGRSCEEIAGELGVATSSVRRILHNSRRKARKEAEAMGDTEQAKRGPRALKVWISGDTGSEPNTVFDYLSPPLAQSVCLAVNKQARTVAEIAEQVEANEGYVQPVVDKLLWDEVLELPQRGRYRTNFIAFDADDWRRTRKLLREPAAEAAKQLAASESRLRTAYERAPLAADWDWERMKWPVYAVLVANMGRERNLPEGCRAPAWPHRPDGGRYWLGAYEAAPDVVQSWTTGFNMHGSLPTLRYGYFWSWGLNREHPVRLAGTDRGPVVEALADGPLTEKELLARLGDDGEKLRQALASLVEGKLAERANGTYRLSFPVFTEDDSEALTSEIDAVVKPIIDQTVVPAITAFEATLDEMGYGFRRDQYGQWRVWFAGDVMAEGVRFLMEQDVLPRPPDPAPPSFCFIAWKGHLPLLW
jgi:RNA polymerase sigma-70 factor (ECF subfamily)